MPSLSSSSTGAGSCGITHGSTSAMDGCSCLNDPGTKGLPRGSVVGRPEAGKKSVLIVEASGRGDLLAEAYRLQGALLLRQAVPDAPQAEAC